MSINIRTDLALEARELVGEEQLPGVTVDTEKSEQMTISRVRIEDEEGSEKMGKPIGYYVTLEVPRLKEKDSALTEEVSKNLADELKRMVEIPIEATVLVIGLGNWNVTPDSLGPKVIEKLIVTRHLIEYMPEKFNTKDGIRPVCALAPGVLGITGIETGDIISGLVEKVKPDMIIAIDALASRSMERISTTIQITDTGVYPGSGVGNKRMGITQENMGVPVIAIGIPTVVDAATMANDTLDMLIGQFTRQAKPGSDFYKLLENLDKEEKYKLIQEVMSPFVGQLVVTPKEIDSLIDNTAKTLAGGLNLALHPGIQYDEVSTFLQ
ncbi:MAG: GPR endopeptidase [Tepidanaerobacter acetatoxydans]|uniref:GPR endopeptidase n=1 Tax=Tepidanaerobacter acetatoxydans TaxID=499229 RepID=UPI00350E4CE3|nr:GPR endopeptidase [Tepidanaerobacter acetatoxydans]